MDVSLTPEMEQFVSRKVQSGLYPSAIDVIREGLQLLRERDESRRDELEEIRRERYRAGSIRRDVARLSRFYRKP